MKPGRDWKGLKGTPVLGDSPVPPPEDDTGVDFSTSAEVPALCVPATDESSTNPNIGEPGATWFDDSDLVWHQL